MGVNEIVPRSTDEEMGTRRCGMYQDQIARLRFARSRSPPARFCKSEPMVDRAIGKTIAFGRDRLPPDSPHCHCHQTDAVHSEFGVPTVQPKRRADQSFGSLCECLRVAHIEELVG